MPGIHQEWTVLPHGKLTEVGDGILTVVGTIHMPLMDFPRRMTVVRLHDRRLIIYSAMALDENEMAKLEQLGPPSFLVVPGSFHRLDMKIWKDRYPTLRIIAPAGARAAVEKVLPVDATQIVTADPDVEFLTVGGTAGQEAGLVVRRAGGTTLVLNDLIGNMRPSPGFAGWVRRFTGFAGDAPMFPIYARFKIVKDKPALKAQLESWADDRMLKRVLVSHGDPIEDQPREALRRLAQSLD
ncbi:MAG: hypothetical protein QOD94_2605 [Alphaproteobacteria bacterium]|nr:hypothetical protein [Alphaproteobacteria bacterium]